MLSLLVGTAAVPLAPREKNNLPGPMIYSARDAPGPMIIDTKFSSVVPLATLDDDFVAKAEEATRAAAAAIKEQTDAIKIEEAKVKESEKAYAAADQQQKAGALSGVNPEDEGLVSEATQKMREDEAAIMKQRDAMQIAEQEARAAIASSPQGFTNENDAAYVANEKASAAAAEATMREDEAKIKAQTDAMEAGGAPVQAPAPSPYAVQQPAPDAVAVAPEAVGVQAPAPEAVGVQAPAPVSVSPEAAAAAAVADADDADMDAEARQKKLEDAQDDAELAEEARRGEEIDKVQEEADKMEELQQEAEQEIEEEKEQTEKQAARAMKKARQAKEKALEKRVLATRSAKAAAQKAAEKAGEELPKPTGKASRFSSARKLSKLFLRGAPSDSLEMAGLTIHCFDDTENWGQKWMPSAMRRDQILGSCAHPPRVLKNSPIAELVGAECDYAFDEKHEVRHAERMKSDRLKEELVRNGVEPEDNWDKDTLVEQLVKAKRANHAERQAERRAARRLESASDSNTSDARLIPARSFWSTSVINYDQRTTFGRAGVILSPDHNVVQCAFPADMGTMDSGCGVTAMNMDLKSAIAGSRWGGYNEVLVDTQAYLDNLPRSLAAFVYGLRGSEAEDVAGDNAGETATTYLAFLDFYNMTEADLPLLRVEYDVPFDKYAPDMFQNGTTAPGAVFSDVSFSAAHIAASYRKRLSAKHHLGKVPEPKLWLGEGHAFREGARKLDKKHEQQIKRQMQTQKQKVQPLKAQLKTELKDVKKLKAQYKKLKAKKAKPSEAELRSELSTEMKQRDILKAELKSEKLKAKVQPWGQ